MKKIVFAVATLLATPALAQVVQSQPTLDQLREAMLSSEATYYLAVARDLQQKLTQVNDIDTKTAAYWAAYVKGLSEKPAEK